MSLLNIETKEDSPEVLAAVAGKPSKYRLSAAEFEILRKFVNDTLQSQELIYQNQELINNAKEDSSNKNSNQNNLGSTVEFWSKKGVVDFVNSKVPPEIIASRVTPSSGFTPPYDSSTTSLAILDMIMIPAGKLSSGSGTLQLRSSVYFNNSGGKAIQIAISNSPILTGATVIAETATISSWQFFVNKTLNVRPTGIAWTNSNGTTISINNIVDFTGGTFPEILATLNFNLPIYIMIAVRKSNFVFWTGYVNSHSLTKY